MNIRHIRYFLFQAGASVWRSPLVQLVAISTTTVSLTVLCSLLTLTANVESLTDRWSRGLGVVAFLSEGLPDSELSAIAEDIRSWPQVDSATVFTREQALRDIQGALGRDRDLLAGIDASVLPASIEIVLKEAHRTPTGRDAIFTRLKKHMQLGHVEKIDFGADMAAKMVRIREFLKLGGLSVALLVLSAVIFIITNTVRLTLFARRDEIDVMRLVGATNWFIRIPFYLEGAFQGLIGAGLALFLTWSGVQMIPLTEFVSDVQTHAPTVQFISFEMASLVVLGSGLIGVLASHLATGRFLRENV